MDNVERKKHCFVKGGEGDEIMAVESMWQLLGHYEAREDEQEGML